MTKEFHDKEIIKEAIWKEKEIKALVTIRPKVKDIWEENIRKEISQMNIDNARVWFRYRSRMTVRVKTNRSSKYRINLG